MSKDGQAALRRQFSSESELSDSKADCDSGSDSQSDSNSHLSHLARERIPRRWDEAFCHAFYWSSCDRDTVLRLLHDDPDELKARMLATDPHCGIEELSRVFNTFASGKEDPKGPQLQSACRFDDE